MKSKITFGKEDKYVTITYTPSDKDIPYALLQNATQWCLNKKDAIAFKTYAIKIEKLIEVELAEKKLSYKASWIMLTFFKVMEGFATGFDVRSKISIEDMAKRLVFTYDSSYKEALKFCQGVLKQYELGGKKESYMKHWRDYDKHNEYRKLYGFHIMEFKENDFNLCLDSILKSTDELLEYFKNANKDN